MGYAPKVFGCDGLDGLLGVENLDASLCEGVMFLTPFTATAEDEATQNFVKAYAEKFNGDVPIQFAADAYDAVYAIKAAAEKAGLTPDMSVSDMCEAMKVAMTEITIDGLTGEGITWTADGEPSKAPKAMVIKDGAKMSKSLGNVVSPEEILEKYGADTARLFILFAAPPERELDWSDQGVEGSFRFLNRVWRIIYTYLPQIEQKVTAYDVAALNEADKELRRILHNTIKKVTSDIETRFNFNTAISSLMELVNALYAYKENAQEINAGLVYEATSALVRMLAPFVPHMTEELWKDAFGAAASVHAEQWPEYDEAALKVDNVEIVLQVNGKVRGRLVVPAEATAAELEKIALADANVQSHIGGATVRKVICVPGRLVNIVAK